MEWISVKDSLPEIGKSVLVWVQNPFFKDNNIHNSYYDSFFSDGSPCWRGIESNVHKSFDDRAIITHWMPLPEPPKTNKP